MKVDVFLDVLCPWSYLGKRRLEAALGDFEGRSDVEVRWRPLALDVREPADGHEHLADIAAAEGLSLDLGAARAPDTFEAHRLLWWAGERRSAVLEGLFGAQHTDGADLGDPAVLVQVAEIAGLSGAAAFLASSAGVEEVKEEIGEARAIGFTSTPVFVFEERWAVEGAQPSDVLIELLEQVADNSIEAIAEGGGGGCCGGGCCG